MRGRAAVRASSAVVTMPAVAVGGRATVMAAWAVVVRAGGPSRGGAARIASRGQPTPVLASAGLAAAREVGRAATLLRSSLPRPTRLAALLLSATLVSLDPASPSPSSSTAVPTWPSRSSKSVLPTPTPAEDSDADADAIPSSSLVTTATAPSSGATGQPAEGAPERSTEARYESPAPIAPDPGRSGPAEDTGGRVTKGGRDSVDDRARVGRVGVVRAVALGVLDRVVRLV